MLPLCVHLLKVTEQGEKAFLGEKSVYTGECVADI